MAATTMYFVHPDHLGTPRVVAGVTVWRWDNLEPFGLTGVQTDPDGNGQAFVFNLRFAGQYFDAESGLFHNRHRDYDSASGRYVQADPIGLAGGISLYSYVGANPLRLIDPDGLMAVCRLSAADKNAMGDAPAVMQRPHRHHIVMENAPKNWNASARQDVLDSQAILKKHNIDINTDLRNFTWAENQGHSQAYAREVLNRLRAGDQSRGLEGVEKALQGMGKILSQGKSL